jgi:hypothetical protein
MCRRVQCRKCGRPTWAGCGAHIEQALAGVPKSERCRCHDEPASPRQGGGNQPSGRSWISRLFGE